MNMKYLKLFESNYKLISLEEHNRLCNDFSLITFTQKEIDDIHWTIDEAFKDVYQRRPQLTPKIQIGDLKPQPSQIVVEVDGTFAARNKFDNVWHYCIELEFDIIKLYDEWFLLRDLLGEEIFKCDGFSGLKSCIRWQFNHDRLKEGWEIPSEVKL